MNIIAQEACMAVSEEGAVKFSTTGDPFVDDFGSISKYRTLRTQEDVNKTMNLLWACNPLSTLKEMAYIRAITRDSRLMSTGIVVPNKGQGLKHEFFRRILWLAEFHPDALYKNLPVFLAAGSWDDLFEELRYDLKNPKRLLDWNKVFILIEEGLKLQNEKDLVKKYLPTCKSRNNQKTERTKENAIIANFIASKLWPTVNSVALRQEKYRKLKSSGVAHTFQQQISKGDYDHLDFNKIPGRVINTLIKPRVTVTRPDGKVVKGDGTTFIERHGLTEKFDAWLDAQPTVKFKGYPYELFKGLCLQPDVRTYKMLNKQFAGLLEGMSMDSNMIACIDVSGSMTAEAIGINGVTAFDIACSMALSFAYQLKGKFNNTYMTFSSRCVCGTVTGKDAVGDYLDMRHRHWEFGSTNLIAVAEKLVELRQSYGEAEFPTGLVAISDGEFQNCGSQTTFRTFKEVLGKAFSAEYVENFKLVLWDIPNKFYSMQPTTKFEAFKDYPNFFYLAGFDPAGLTFLTGVTPDVKEARAPQTAAELFATAMNQELLNLLEV